MKALSIQRKCRVITHPLSKYTVNNHGAARAISANSSPEDNLGDNELFSSSHSSQSQEAEAYKIIDDNPTPEDKIIMEQNLAKLLLDIKQLKPKYQEVIHLRYFKELSYKEISHEINEPMNNVKIKLLRAKKILAEIINKS